MRLRLASLVVLALSLLVGPPARCAPGDVLVLSTPDGAVLRVPGASLPDCSVVKSDPPRFIVSIGGVDLKSRVLPNRSEWLRSVRIVGAEALGGGESRLIIETGSSMLTLRLESAAEGGVAIVVSGQFDSARPPAAEEDAPSPEPPAAAPEASGSREAAPAPASEAAKADRPRQRPSQNPVAAAPPEGGPVEQPWRNDVDGMVVIPGGEFVMGSVEGLSFADESPEQVIRLSAFRLDSREVTVSEFARSPLPMPRQPETSQDPSAPVVNVTWHEAAEYCEWKDKRLPTEAEWERAARSTDRRTYPWGTQWSPTRANTGLDGDGFSHLSPVGALNDGASAEGALDLSGNAWEWTADWYRKDTYGGWRNPNPSGPSQGSHKVARGGSYRSSSATTATSTVRLALPPSTRRDDVGFRCASSD